MNAKKYVTMLKVSYRIIVVGIIALSILGCERGEVDDLESDAPEKIVGKYNVLINYNDQVIDLYVSGNKGDEQRGVEIFYESGGAKFDLSLAFIAEEDGTRIVINNLSNDFWLSGFAKENEFLIQALRRGEQLLFTDIKQEVNQSGNKTGSGQNGANLSGINE